MTRVLITGVNGFTGGHLAEALLADGHTVRGMLRNPAAAPQPLRGRIEVAAGDLRDARAVEQAVAGCDVVYHVAALFRDASGPSKDYWDVNVIGTEHVLTACERHRVGRLVYCSTIGVYGHLAQVPGDETAPYAPTDDYQRSKVAAEERVWAWHRRTGIPATVIRPATIYGPGDLRFLKLFRAIRNGRFVMLGSGQVRLHPVHIQDLIHGYRLCGTHPAAVGESFIIAGERYVSLNEFAGLIADAVHVPAPAWRIPVWPVYAAGALCEAVCVPLRINPPLHRRRVGFFTHDRGFTFAKAERLLGYRPQVRLADGLGETARWYAAQGYVRLNGAGA